MRANVASLVIFFSYLFLFTVVIVRSRSLKGACVCNAPYVVRRRDDGRQHGSSGAELQRVTILRSMCDFSGPCTFAMIGESCEVLRIETSCVAVQRRVGGSDATGSR